MTLSSSGRTRASQARNMSSNLIGVTDGASYSRRGYLHSQIYLWPPWTRSMGARPSHNQPFWRNWSDATVLKSVQLSVRIRGRVLYAPLTQLVEVIVLETMQCQFESDGGYIIGQLAQRKRRQFQKLFSISSNLILATYTPGAGHRRASKTCHAGIVT